MAFLTDDSAVGGQFVCGAGVPKALGVGPAKINGSGFCEGPFQVGAAGEHNTAKASLMIGQLKNPDAKVTPLYSLWVRFYSRFQDFVRVDLLLKARFIEAKIVRTQILQASVKNFVIPHPTKEGKQLVHTCLEGPENGVYVRGKLLNKNVIELPEYWTNLVDEGTITVSITPVGAHQDIIVKRIGDNKVYLQAKPGIPINCFYHIFGTRKDVPNLVTEIDS
jgi:hypothetical protein